MKDYFGYQGKVCVVTGAASGMGKAATEMLVDIGAVVYALDFAEVTVPGIKSFIKVNLGEKASIDEAFAAIPDTIDMFFGIAGVSGMKSDYNTTVIINFVANKYITEEYLTKRVPSEGAIAFITSTGGLRWEVPDNRSELEPFVKDSKGWDETVAALEALNMNEQPGPMGYMASKRALNYYIGLAVGMFGPNKIRVNGVMPAQTMTGMTDEFVAMKGGDKDAAIASNGYANRFAESREMAEPLVFLNSHMASCISGQILIVDFGADIEVKTGKTPDRMNFKLFSK